MRELENREVERYHRDGYVIARGLFDRQEISLLETWVEDVQRHAGGDPTLDCYFEGPDGDGEPLLRQVECFGAAHRSLYDFSTSEAMLFAASRLLGGASVLFKEKINFKLPGGGGYLPHRDGRFWWSDADGQPMRGWEVYASDFVSILIGIDAATSENGCLEVAPGRHDRAALRNSYGPLTKAEADAMTFVACPTLPGDAVFFDALTPHRSGINRSAQPRRALYLTYNPRADGDQRERYFADKRASLARQGLEREADR